MKLSNEIIELSLNVALIVSLVFQWIATLMFGFFTVVWFLSLAFLLLTWGSKIAFLYSAESSKTGRKQRPK